METDRLSLVFGALADPTRRAILTRLADGDATVAELAAPAVPSRPTRPRASRQPAAPHPPLRPAGARARCRPAR